LSAAFAEAGNKVDTKDVEAMTGLPQQSGAGQLALQLAVAALPALAGLLFAC
jgi:hypothetical protein